MRDLRAVVIVGVFVTVLILQLATLTTAGPLFNYESSQTYFSQTRTRTKFTNYTETSSSTRVSYSFSTYAASSKNYSKTYQSSYMIVAPSTIRASSFFNIGVNLPNALGPCDVTAVIKTDTQLVAGGRGTFYGSHSRILAVRIPDELPHSYIFYLDVKVNGSIDFESRYMLIHQRKTISFFIQTDKPVYKPNDLVQFRAFGLFSNYKVYQDLLDVTIYDSNDNKVRQWLNDTHQLDGLVSGEFPLPARPLYGKWKIKVSAEGQSRVRSFMVMEYVKPLFEVLVKLPPYILQSQSEVVTFVQARFSSGNPVQGHKQVIVKVINKNMTDEEIRNVTAFLDVEMPFDNGNSKLHIPTVDLVRNSIQLDNRTLFVEAIITENMTGKMYRANDTTDILLSGEVLKFPFINARRFKPTLDYIVYLKVSAPDGNPLLNVKREGVLVSIKYHILDVDGPPPVLGENHTQPHLRPVEKKLGDFFMAIPVDGVISFPIVPEKKAVAMEITAMYEQVSATMKVYTSYSPSYSFIKLYLAQRRSYVVGDRIEFRVKATEVLHFFTYQVIAKGELLYTERHFGYRSNSTKFFLNATVAMIPTAKVVVFYTRDDGEIVADSYHIEIQGNFPNEVQLTMDEKTVAPGTQIATYMIADGGGRVYLHAIDQRVYYKNSISEISREEIYRGLDALDPQWHIDSERRTMEYTKYGAATGAKDAYTTFWGSGLIAMTDHLFFNYDPLYEGQVEEELEATTEGGLVENIEGIVTNDLTLMWTHFPESWLWTDVEVCANGEAIHFVKVPDVATTWLIHGFSINKNTGFGMPIGPHYLEVFKAFFVVANFPTYNVIVGEEMALEYIIFNFLSTDQKVLLRLAKSHMYMSAYRDCNGVDYRIQREEVVFIEVKSGHTASVYFPIVPLVVGAIDVVLKVQTAFLIDSVSKPIKIVPPGSAMDYNIPVYIDLTGNDREFSKSVSIDLPSNIVEHSQFMKVSVFGDLLGPSIVGMSNLLAIPMGCGEQTMLGMATDLYIAEYLRYTNQLSGAIQDKAYGLMITGYQQELTFRHSDGSFSAFGTRDDSGSMWLTAFVARVFHQASYHIFIEKQVIRDAIDWMVARQYENGSFPEPGRVIDKHIQSNSGMGPSLSAFVFLALVENQDLYDEDTEAGMAFFAAKDKCLIYLETQAACLGDLYFLSMASFALHLAESNQTEALLDRLMTKAVRRGHYVYWHEHDSHKATKGTWHHPNPATAVDVEMTSYILATVALREDIHLGRKIFYWLLSHRNAHGGFYSTQDTVVAFMAMGLFAELVYTDDIDMKTWITLDTGAAYSFTINKHNALTNQRRETSSVPFHVNVEASGKGLAVVDLAVYFNIESEIEDTTFDLNVTVIEETNFFIQMEVCASWLGDGGASGMAVMEIIMPSGFEPDKDSIPEMDVLRKIEVESKKLVLYFDEICRQPLCLTVGLNRTGLIGKNKPSVVKLYDYYEPTNQITDFYRSKHLTQLSICDICHQCHNCNVKVPTVDWKPLEGDEDTAIEKEMSKED